jgi:hypothetical protein
MENFNVIKAAAKEKSRLLTNNSMIRLDSSVDSLWVYKFSNQIYIGFPAHEIEKKKFLNPAHEILEMKDAKGNTTEFLQAI